MQNPAFTYCGYVTITGPGYKYKDNPDALHEDIIKAIKDQLNIEFDSELYTYAQVKVMILGAGFYAVFKIQ